MSLHCPHCESEVDFGDQVEIVCDGCKEKLTRDLCGEREKTHRDSVDCLDIRDIEWEYQTSTMEKTPEGYLKGRACVTTVGIYSYLSEDGTVRRELRTRGKVMDPASLETLKLKPITNGHPPATMPVSVENYKALSVGHTGSVITTDEDRVYIDLIITDPTAIDAIEKGRKALSCGYKRQLKWESGIHNGGVFDCEQENIVYNHLALVDRGRAGDDAVLRLDGFTNIGVYDTSKPIQENKMKVVLDGKEYEVEDALGAAITQLQSAADEAGTLKASLVLKDSELTKLKASADTLRDAQDALQAKLDTLTTNQDGLDNQIKEKVSAEVKSRLALIAQVSSHGVKLVGDEDGVGIMKALILKAQPKAVLDGVSEEYVRARFDAVLDSLGEGEQIDRENLDAAQGTGGQDGGVRCKQKPLSSEAAHAKMCQDMQDAYLVDQVSIEGDN